MSLAAQVRRLIPRTMRAALRRSRLLRRALNWKYGGVASKPHPLAPYMLHFDGARHIGWTVGGLEEFEPRELACAGEMIGRLDCRCVWDVGANVGIWSLYFASLAPPVEQVVCFEPDPANLRFLRLNCEKNQVVNMQLRDVALSAAAGSATLYSDPLTGTTGSLEEGADFIGKHYGAKRLPFDVHLSTIDDEVARGVRPPDFIKIDVEGHELQVLRGGRRTLVQRHPALIMEVTANHDELGGLLHGLGYRLTRPQTGEPIDRPEFETAAEFGGR